MTDNDAQGSQDSDGREDAALLTEQDFTSVDPEAPIRDSSNVDCWSLARRYEAAGQQQEQSGNEVAARVFSLIANIARMHFKPEDRAEPYGPFWAGADGRQTMVPGDLRGGQSETLAKIAFGIRNPGLRARIADVSWYNDRKCSTMAQLAISSFCEAVQAVHDGSAQFFHEDRTASSRDGADMLLRACRIAHATGWKDPEGSRLKALVRTVIQDTLDRNDHRGFLDTAPLGLQFRFHDPASLARDAKTLAATDNLHPFVSRELWQFAASAHQQDKNDTDRDRCLVSAVESLVALANAEGGRGMVAASHLMTAIQELGRIKNTTERRQQLEVRLREAQASIRDEMGSISTEFDAADCIKLAREAVGGLSLVQALAAFVQFASSPDPTALRDEILQQAEEYPLSSIFPMSIVDNEGKFVAQSPALTGDEEGDALAVHHRIARQERLRRQIATYGLIDPARRLIQTEHPLDPRDFAPLACMSPFVPGDREYLFSLAFARFFGGDFISALHLLVPQLENSLRYVLKQAGRDPSSIRSDTTQENRSLSVLLKKERNALEERFGPAIVYEIENLFDFEGGPAIRHQLAHGLMSEQSCYDADALYACWFIFRLCCLPVLSRWEQLVTLMEENWA